MARSPSGAIAPVDAAAAAEARQARAALLASATESKQQEVQEAAIAAQREALVQASIPAAGTDLAAAGGRTVDIIRNELTQVETEKTAVRADIKLWTENFVKVHKREPTAQDKKNGDGRVHFVKFAKLTQSAALLKAEWDAALGVGKQP